MNRPLADSMGYIVNKFDHVWGGGSCTRGQGQGLVQEGGRTGSLDRQTENITFTTPLADSKISVNVKFSSVCQ